MKNAPVVGPAPRRLSEARHLLHPAALLSLLLLVVNDHYLKQAYPGTLSGKVSDFCFMVLMPLWLHAAVWITFGPRLRKVVEKRTTLLAATILTGFIFVLMNTTAIGDAIYRVTLGSLQWPLRTAASLIKEGSLATWAPVKATPDPTDLWALRCSSSLALSPKGRTMALPLQSPCKLFSRDSRARASEALPPFPA